MQTYFVVTIYVIGIFKITRTMGRYVIAIKLIVNLLVTFSLVFYDWA